MTAYARPQKGIFECPSLSPKTIILYHSLANKNLMASLAHNEGVILSRLIACHVVAFGY